MTNEQKHEIEIPELPEGWRAVAYRIPNTGEHFIFQGSIVLRYKQMMYSYLVVEKIQPREITLVETDEVRRPYPGEYFRRGLVDSPVEVCLDYNFEHSVRIWEIKEES